MDRHSNLPLAEQQRALENEPGFRDLPPQTQQRMRDRLTQLNNMTPEQRRRILERTEADGAPHSAATAAGSRRAGAISRTSRGSSPSGRSRLPRSSRDAPAAASGHPQLRPFSRSVFRSGAQHALQSSGGRTLSSGSAPERRAFLRKVRTDLLIKRGSRPKAAIFYCGEGIGLGGKNTVCFLAQRQKDVLGRKRSSQSEVRRSDRESQSSPVTSPERSSSSLVDVVCRWPAELPIQLSKDACRTSHLTAVCTP